MSNEVNNLASSFVAMAQAFEKLPQVQAELDTAHTQIEEYAKQVQRLEMRLMDAKEELDTANASTRKAEVERDHAETMFLEADSKLDGIKSFLSGQVNAARDLFNALEPPKPEPVIEQAPITEQERAEIEAIPMQEPTPVQGQSEPLPTSPTPSSDYAPVDSGIGTQPETVEAVSPTDPTTAPSWATQAPSPSIAPGISAVSGESVASSTTGESVNHPTVLEQSAETGNAATSGTASSTENVSQPTTTESWAGVSVPSDPTPATESSLGSDLRDSAQPKPYEGKRYTDVPFYVSLVEWLNGGGTEELYYAR